MNRNDVNKMHRLEELLALIRVAVNESYPAEVPNANDSHNLWHGLLQNSDKLAAARYDARKIPPFSHLKHAN